MTIPSAPTTIEKAAAHLRHGGAVVFPTDTVYGLGVAVDFAPGPDVLFALKQRPSDKPVSWLVAGIEALELYAADAPPLAYEWARMFWPGGLTLIVPASKRVPAAFRATNGSIGLRMPANETALALIRAVGCPLATTSANISGQPGTARFSELAPSLLDAAPALCDDAGAAGTGVASTVIDCCKPTPHILRQGDVFVPMP